VLVRAVRPVRSITVPKGQLAFPKVLFELDPFSIRGFAIFLLGPIRASTRDVCLDLADYLFGINRNVALGGGEVEVAEQLRGDVDGQSAVDGVGREESAEVVRGEADVLSVDVA
jgi:hypothetical protein